jgi:hypothetical protein
VSCVLAIGSKTQHELALLTDANHSKSYMQCCKRALYTAVVQYTLLSMRVLDVSTLPTYICACL